MAQSKKLTLQVRNVNNLLRCRLCDGYFREPYTIIECLHTFCKVCIMQYVADRENVRCPNCGIDLGTDAMKIIRADHVLENIVNKIYEAVTQQDSKEASKPAAESPAKKAKVDEQGKSATVYRVRRGEEITFELKLNEAAHITPGSAASGGASSSDEAAAAQSSQKAESNGSARSKFAPLERPFVRVSDKASIKLLRKFIAEKLGVPVEEVDITCKNVVLPDNHTLEFIKKTQWTAGGLMVLGYQKRVRKL
jgi:hypothetical protein